MVEEQQQFENLLNTIKGYITLKGNFPKHLEPMLAQDNLALC